jgi:hypothetical protein
MNFVPSRLIGRCLVLLSALTGTITAGAQITPSLTIQPGAVWRDNRNEIIQAHGAGIIKADDTYYWFGEDHTGESSDQLFLNVKCYASKDLVHWTFRGDSLTRQKSGDLGPDRVVERPKVIYNEPNRTFVMYAHIDDKPYREAKVGVATCDRVDGEYTYRGSFQPLGHQSRDMTLFRDDDGAAYLIFEDRQSGVRIGKLSPDYLTVEREVALIPHPYEAPAMVKAGNVYFLLGSHLTGWDLNANEYATADSPAGPWSEFHPVAPPETKTYRSQTAYILPVAGSRETSYVYLGDRWNGKGLKDSRYVWMPLRIDPHQRTMTLTPDAPWTLDAATGFCSLPIASAAPAPAGR